MYCTLSVLYCSCTTLQGMSKNLEVYLPHIPKVYLPLPLHYYCSIIAVFLYTHENLHSASALQQHFLIFWIDHDSWCTWLMSKWWKIIILIQWLNKKINNCLQMTSVESAYKWFHHERELGLGDDGSPDQLGNHPSPAGHHHPLSQDQVQQEQSWPLWRRGRDDAWFWGGTGKSHYINYVPYHLNPKSKGLT